MSRLLMACNLCKSYLSGSQHLQILVNLSLELEEGQMVAVTGASGSGKSTLLHLIGGMEKPDKGSIAVFDKELTTMNSWDLSRFRNGTVGFVFQFHHLLPEFTALENIMMPLLLRGASASDAGVTAHSLLEDVGLKERAHHRPGELSGGEQQRVALARALAGKPRILLADEPTGNLDPITGEAITALICTLHTKHSLTSIIVTHNERLAKVCSSTYRLENGQLHLAGTLP